MVNKHRVRKIKWTASNSIATKRRSGTLAASFPEHLTPTECLNRWPGFCPKLLSIDTVFGYCFQWFSTIISMEMTPSLHFQTHSLPFFASPWNVACQAPLSMQIFLVRILEWVAISSSRRSSWPRERPHVPCIGRQILYHCTTWEASMLHSSPSVVCGIL